MTKLQPPIKSKLTKSNLKLIGLAPLYFCNVAAEKAGARAAIGDHDD